MASLTLLSTIVFALAFGIASGYAAIVGILHLFGRRNAQAAPTTTVLTTVQTASGD